MNIQECIKVGMEKELDCAIPNLGYGEVIAPIGKHNKTCSSGPDYKKYLHLSGISIPRSYPTEAAIAKEFGCIASCKENKQ